MTVMNLQCRLAQRPAPGLPDPSIWSFTEEPVAEASDGYSFIAIAGTAFSLAPEIRLISRDDRVVDSGAIADLIRDFLIVGE